MARTVSADGVAAADGGEDVILHGLRIHADPCDAVTFQNGQLFRR